MSLLMHWRPSWNESMKVDHEATPNVKVLEKKDGSEDYQLIYPEDEFCDNNCSWTAHHPDCVYKDKEDECS